MVTITVRSAATRAAELVAGAVGYLSRSGGLHVAVRQRVPAEEDGDGGQVRQDLVLADVSVLRAARIGAGGAGVAVPAPVGGLAVRPG